MRLLKDSFKAEFHPFGNHKVGSTIVVEGNVEVAVDVKVRLERMEPQGINPKILLLKIHAEEPPPGKMRSHAIHSVEVSYQEEASKDQYTAATVLGDGESVTVKV